MPDLYAAADALLEMAILSGKAQPKPIAEMLPWQERALRVFSVIYGQQRDRIIDGITNAERAQFELVLQRLFAAEAPIVKQQVRRFFAQLAPDMMEAAIAAIGGASIDADAIVAGIITASDELAGIMAQRVTATSRDLTLGIVRSWLEEEGSTVGDLRERVRLVWEGPRPDAAARTEVTRLNSRVRAETWAASGLVWGYNVVTRNDGLVRPTHTQAALNGPYPLDDTEHRTPVNGDVNCRCGMSAVTFASARERGLI